MFGEPGFDEPPPGRIILVAFGQPPYAMKMVRQNDSGLDDKRPLLHDVPECLAKDLDGISRGEEFSTVFRCQSEKVETPRNVGSAIAHSRIFVSIQVVVGLRFANPTYLIWGSRGKERVYRLWNPIKTKTISGT